MKFNCGPTWAERRKALHGWHDFYAILPRRVSSNDCRCFELIERKGMFYPGKFVNGMKFTSFWVWEYRAKDGA
jgi:hypothetical protein